MKYHTIFVIFEKAAKFEIVKWVKNNRNICIPLKLLGVVGDCAWSLHAAEIFCHLLIISANSLGPKCWG